MAKRRKAESDRFKKLVANCQSSKKMRDAMRDALDEAWASHRRGAVSAAWLQHLTSAYNEASDIHEGLKLVLFTVPVSTLDGALAKLPVLRDEDLETTIARWKARDPAILAAVEHGLDFLP
jgi:hypothetical protein